jgi:hypothetical protein
MENQRPNQANRLTDIVDRLINTLLPNAFRNKSFFVNDIPDHFQLSKDTPVITSVLGGLLSTVVSNAKGSCIWLSAKLHGNVILVDVKNDNGLNPHAIGCPLQRLQTLAEKDRGTIGFTSHQHSITSLTFGFYP